MPGVGKVRIPSVPNPGSEIAYNYEARRGRPMLFQVMKADSLQQLYTTFLALHVSPRSIEERMVKSKSVVMTYGGYVEFVWPDELGSLSGEASTGAFFSPESGLTAGNERRSRGGAPGGRTPGRRGTIAWERKEDFLDLFRMNGCVFNAVGQPVIRGRIMCIYDRGIFIGHFSTFEEVEDDSHPFSFELTWEFKIEHAVYRLPDTASSVSTGGGQFFAPPKPPAEGR